MKAVRLGISPITPVISQKEYIHHMETTLRTMTSTSLSTTLLLNFREAVRRETEAMMAREHKVLEHLLSY